MSPKPTDPSLARDFNTIWHPCTQMKDHETVPPLLIERGEGVYLYDRENNSYLDVIASWWVNLFGHNHPRLNAAVTQQLGKMAHVMFAGVTHQPAIELADALVEATPGNLTRVFFSDNGSTSVEVALKMSLQYWRQTGQERRTRFIHLKGAYHGETLGALAVCGLPLFREKFDTALAQNIEVAGPDCYRCPYNLTPETCRAECFESMETALNDHHNRVAAVIVEPLVQGAAGMKMYPPLYLKKLQEACGAFDTHVIYDEIAVGFGRAGALFVCESHGLRPTFLCLSKAITSGYLPLAATLTEERIFQAFYGEYPSLKMFLHSHSYTANPLACACANETFSLLRENGFLESLQPKIRFMGEYGEKLRELKWCGEFRQTGMIARIELARNRQTREPFPLEKRLGYQIYLEGLKRGVLMRPLGNVIYFIPPLIISREEIKIMIDTAYDCIRAVLDSP
ncbi:MAG: adenosylmethionine--8-amino-7-oxononanoate transaminase [Nitrospinales bacterium]